MLRSFIHPLVLGVALAVVAPTAFLAPAYAEDAPAEKSEPTTKPVKGPRLFGVWAKWLAQCENLKNACWRLKIHLNNNFFGLSLFKNKI